MKAWTTLLTEPSYLPGLRTMWRSLQDVGTAYPFVVMVTDGVDAPTRELLRADGCEVVEVPRISPAVDDGYVFGHFTEVWTKLNAWALDYERLVLIDSDMLAVAPMDELFTMPLPDGPDGAPGVAACHTCRCNPEHHDGYPADWVPANCAFTYLSAPLPAAFEPYFNAGLIVLEPSAAAFEALTAIVAGVTDLTDYPFPEQDLLNRYYRGRWAPLPFGFNALKTHLRQHPAVWSMAQVKNIHYLLAKPWTPAALSEAEAPYRSLVDLWQATFDRLDTA